MINRYFNGLRRNRTGITRAVLYICALAMLVSCFVSCDADSDSNVSTDRNTVTKLSFKSAVSYEYLKQLDGTTVTINGYLATSSPVDGSFIFLMNMPYQSCPFCKPNTSQLSNTMEVYPKSGQTFEYTNQAVCVTGKLKVAPTETDCFTDQYGYQFNFKIVDAVYTVLKAEDLEGDTAIWQEIAGSNLITEINSMYEYVNFVCLWNTYFVNSYQLEDGTVQTGYYLYAADALNYLTVDGAQWNYGYRDGYFDDILAKIDRIDNGSGVLKNLYDNVTNAKELARDAVSKLENSEYTYELQYVEKFGTEDYIYTVNGGEALASRMDACWAEFSTWLASWEM